ncbi:MSHA pilin protein MshA [Gammaproteobacteria bacterium]
MLYKEKGFTLIELVMVIVILGILAATALPKFVDLKGDAESAALKGVAGAVSAAFSTNFAGQVLNTAKGVAVSGSTVNVSAAANSVMQGSMPTNYTATAGASTVACGTGNSVGIAVPITISNSTLTGGTTTASATLICTG